MGVKRSAGRFSFFFFFFFFAQNADNVFLFSYSKEDTANALVFIMHDGSFTNNLLVVILFHN